MKKRIWSILLALCMVLTLLPVMNLQANAANLMWPVPGHTNLSQGYHGGNAIDISDGSIAGATIVAAIGGTVSHIFYCGEQHYGSDHTCHGFGTGLAIIGDDGRAYQYAHMLAGSIPSNVYNGARVERGQAIGQVGKTGNATGYHLHFGVSYTSRYWDNGPDPSTLAYDYDYFQKDNNTISNDYGTVFYAYITLNNPWMHLTAVGGENGSNVVLASTNSRIPKQIWRFERISDGSYIITNEYSGRALEVGGSANTNGGNVSLWDYGGAAGQRWFLSLNTSSSPYSYIFTPGHCDLVMDCAGGATAAGTNIQIYTRNGTAAQNFNVYALVNDGVHYSKPAKPAATSIQTGVSAVAGTACTLQWDASAKAAEYDSREYIVTIFDSDGNEVHTKSGLTTNSYTYTFANPGTYSVKITAVNTMYYDYKTVGAAKTITVKTPCEANGHVWDDGVVTQEPTATAEGVKTYTCTVCGATRTEAIPKLDPVQTNPFTDVAEGKFYYDPILWAISQDPQITTGVTKTAFVPDRICTRAHVVTFLWRANGCPEPTNLSSSFKDVKDTSKYYYKAVLWASEQGITTGYSDGTFRPDDECTRGQVVTFLWRAKGQPTPSSATIPFTDVPAGKYYTTAVLWALQNNITKGRTATTFGPDDACTRGHVVTFLYRAYA